MKQKVKFISTLPLPLQDASLYPLPLNKLLNIDMRYSNKIYKLARSPFYNSMFFGCFAFNKPISKCLRDDEYQK